MDIFCETRDELGRTLAARGLTSMGCEVGVERGEYARTLLQTWPGTLYGVDVRLSAEAAQLKREYGERYVLCGMDSLSAASMFDDGHFDFVYIDADHRYVHVRNDITAWWPKVRSGGIFCGHDYHDSLDTPRPKYKVKALDYRHPDPYALTVGVKSAVDEFALRHDLKVWTTGQSERRSPSWFIIKPKKKDPR